MIDRAYDRLLFASRRSVAAPADVTDRRRGSRATICSPTPGRTGVRISPRSPSSATFRRSACAARSNRRSVRGRPAVRRPDPHLMAMPPASSGHDYIGTAANQVYIRLGQPALSRSNRDYDTFLVLNQILGGSGAFESRLWQELRQKRGLVYSVEQLARGRRRSRRLPRRAQRVARSASSRPSSSCGASCERLQNEPVSANRTRKRPRCAWSATRCSTKPHRRGQAKQLLDIAVNDLPLDYYRTLNERFARITPADVQRVARAYLRPSRLVEVYAGPSGPWAQHDDMIDDDRSDDGRRCSSGSR